MIDPFQLTREVIRPVLQSIGLWSENAERLVLGTACAESACGLWLVQLRDGPARGIFQMECATHDDLLINFLDFRPLLKEKIGYWTKRFEASELVGNLNYAAAMCRVQYLRAPEEIPDTLQGQAELYKLRYNTPLGASTPEKYIRAWQQFIGNQILGR